MYVCMRVYVCMLYVRMYVSECVRMCVYVCIIPFSSSQCPPFSLSLSFFFSSLILCHHLNGHVFFPTVRHPIRHSLFSLLQNRVFACVCVYVRVCLCCIVYVCIICIVCIVCVYGVIPPSHKRIKKTKKEEPLNKFLRPVNKFITNYTPPPPLLLPISANYKRKTNIGFLFSSSRPSP